MVRALLLQAPTADWAAAGEDAAKWLTDFLGKPVRLVRYVGEQFLSLEATDLLSSQKLQEAIDTYMWAPHVVPDAYENGLQSKGGRSA